MQQVAISVLIASAVFFVLLNVIDVAFRDAALSSEVLVANGFRTLIFAMAYAAVKVATIMFKGSTK